MVAVPGFDDVFMGQPTTNDVTDTIPQPESKPNAQVQPHQSNNPTIQVVYHVIYAYPKPKPPYTNAMPDTMHLPCTARLAHHQIPNPTPLTCTHWH